MATAQFYEDLANKIKSQTWKESDRFNKFDRLNLILADKLSKIKPLLMQYENDPAKQYALSAGDKQTIATLKKYSPSLFKEAEPLTPQKYKTPQNTLQAKQKTAASTITKLGLAGIVKKPGEALTTAGEKGYLPDLRNKNILGIAKESVMFPLEKLMQTLSIFPRAGAGGVNSMLASLFEQTGLKKAGIGSIADLERAKQNPSLIKDKSQIDLSNLFQKFNKAYLQGYKGAATAAVEPMINTKSQYSGTGYTQLLEKQGEGTKLTKPFGFTKDWEKGNWGQRLFSGLAGSPADIAGFAADIILDPLTYITGGLGKGAKMGVSLTEDLIEGGVKILPKGAEIGLSKVGREALEVFTKAKYGNVIDDISKGVIKAATGATDDIAKATMLNALRNKAINEFVQETPAISKYLDLGGTKLFGQTIVPGYKYAQQFGKLKNTGAMQTLGKLFDENAKIPNELVPFKNWILSAGEAERSDFIKQFATVIKDSNKADLDKIQKYMWQMADIERANNKIETYVSKIIDAQTAGKSTKALENGITRVNDIIEKYANKIKGFALTDKQLGVADNLKNFWKKVATQYSEATGKPLNAYDIYTPIRYEKDIVTGTKSTMLGAMEQPFVKARNITMAQAERLQGLGELGKPKSLVENTTQRLFEQERNVFRSRILQEVKQFGSDTAREGMVEIKNIPELAGTYLPKEYEKVFKTTYSTFFGDDAFKNVMKIYDKGLTMWKRWALATPGYHFRNFFTDNVSGLMEYGINWYNPKYWSDMTSILKQEHKLITLNGISRYADDVFKEMQETGELVTQTGIEGLVGGATTKAGKAIQKVSPAEWSLKFGVKREDVGRVLAGVIERDAGSSKIISAANVKKVFFDYAHSLTPFEKNVVKRAIPFYTWLKNNLRRQVELIFTRTGRYATIPKAMNFVENISKKPEGYEEFQQPYLKDLGAFATPLRTPGLPDWLANLMKKQRTTQAGDMLQFSPNFGFQDWSRLNPKDLFSSFAPQIKVLVELGFNKNMFYGSKIYGGGTNYTEGSALIQKAFGWLPKSVLDKIPGIEKRQEDGKIIISPTANYILSQLPQYGLTQRGFGGTENSPYQNISAGFGLKFAPYNETKAKSSYTQDWQTQATEQIGNYEQQQGKDYKLPATDDIGTAYKQIYANYLANKYPNYAKANYIKEMTKYSGSTAEIKLMIELMQKPYLDELDKIKDMGTAELAQYLLKLGINPTMQDVSTTLQQSRAQ